MIDKVKSLQEYRYMGIKTLKGTTNCCYYCLSKQLIVVVICVHFGLLIAAELYERMKISQQDLREKQAKKFRKILKLEVCMVVIISH